MQLNTVLKVDWDLVVPKNDKECMELYKNSIFDFVIVDFSLDNNLVLLNEITKLNSEQRIITLSSNIESSEKSDCIECINNYNRRRVMKPIDLKELYETIINFDNMACKYFKSFKDVNKVVPILLRNYKICNFDPESKVVHCESNNQYMLSNQYYGILSELEKYKINYKIISDYNIQIK